MTYKKITIEFKHKYYNFGAQYQTTYQVWFRVLNNEEVCLEKLYESDGTYKFLITILGGRYKKTELYEKSVLDCSALSEEELFQASTIWEFENPYTLELIKFAQEEINSMQKRFPNGFDDTKKTTNEFTV